MQIDKSNHHCANGSKGKKPQHPCHDKVLPRLRRVGGQIDGVIKMIEERRYCPEIIIQVKAAESALKSIEGEILKTHLKGCVRDAMNSKSEKEIETKIEEMIKVFLQR